MKDLKERTLRGGLAKICAQGAGFVLRIGSLMILARLLDPKDFGLVAMVTVVTGVFSLFRDAGLSLVTVQRATISQEQLSTLFWINMLLGVGLALVTAALAPVLAAFYHEPRLFWMTIAMAPGFVLNAAGVQHSALLQRHVRFGAVAAIDTLALLVSIAVGVGLAAAGWGYWGLVAMALALPGVSTAGYWFAAAWLPGLPHRGIELRSMMRFGGAVTLNSLIVYVAYNVDKILLGRLWGAEALGTYGRAYQLVNIPTDNLNSAIGGIAISALSRLQQDPPRFKGYFLKGYSVVLTLTVPMTIACALFAEDIIVVLLGPKWTGASTIFRYLAPTILAFALINPVTWLLFSTGQVGRSLKMALVIAPLVILADVVGVAFGPSGVAFAYSAMMMALVIPMIAWATHGSIVSPRDILKVVIPPCTAAIAAGAIGLAAGYWLGRSLSPFQRLVLESSVLLVSYAFLLVFAMGQRGFYFDLIRDLRSLSGPRPVRADAIATLAVKAP